LTLSTAAVSSRTITLCATAGRLSLGGDMHAGRRLLFTAALFAALAGPAQAKELKIAVLDIRALGTDAAKAELLSEIALTEASSMGGFDVIGKSDIASVIGFEKQKQVMGCAEDSNCLAEIGGALGVDMILVGSLGTLGDLFRLDLKLVDAKKAKVRARVGVTVEGKESQLVAAVQKAVRDLLSPLKAEAQANAQAAKEKEKEREKERDRERAREKEAERQKAAAASQGGVPPRAPLPPEPSTPGSARRTWGWVAGGVGLACVAGGAVVGLQARAALDDEKAAAADNDLTAYEDSKKKVSSLSHLADGLFVAGAAGVGVGAWLLLTGRPAGPVALDVVPLPGGALATVSGGF
jgi:TolB-like protein